MADGYRFRVSPPSVYTEINGGQKSVEDLAELLQLDFEKITLKIVNSYDFATDVLKYSSSYGARRRTSYYEDRGQAFPDDLFPNIQTVFADEIDKTSVVNTMTNSGSSVYEEKYSRNNLERAKQQRVFNYFYNEVDYTKEDSFDLFLAYLKKTNDINYKSLSKIDSLSFEQIQKIVTELKSAKNTFEDINLFIKFPKLYTKEKALEILRKEWFYKYSNETDYSYQTRSSHIGMSKENVAFRKKLDSAYKELMQESIYDIKFNDKTYFDKLCEVATTYGYNQDLAREAQNEIAYEHLDQYISQQKEAKNTRLAYILELDSNGEIKNSFVNEKIISALEEIVNKENQENFLINSTDKKRAYVLYQLLNHKLKNDDMEVFQKLDDMVIKKALENRDKISDDYLRKIYQVAWFYNKGEIEPEILRSEYKSKFSTDIDDDVSHIEWEHFPIGSRRINYLLKERESFVIAKYHADEFLNLPLEEINKRFGEINVWFNDNFELKHCNSKEQQETYQALLALKLKCIERYGAENLSLTKYDYEVLGYRYLHGIRNEYEINFLRKYSSECPWKEDSILEKEFNKEGRTLYTISRLSDLISYNREDKINLVLKDGYVVDDEAKRYCLFNKLVNKTYYGAQKDEKYTIYLDTLLKNNEIDIKKAEKYEDFEIDRMMDFCVDMYHKDNSLTYKPYIQRLAQKARCEGKKYIVEERATELLLMGIKVHYTQDLISYRKRGIEVDYPEDPQLYDFNEKFLCEESYHHSDGSYTTFLNEMLWYKNEKGVVTALNNGANPFIKAGFFRDKFEAMPFNMFFNRELKNNNEAGLKDFMGYIASNINEDKKEVIKDIWNSLGGKLRSDPRVQNIMHNTDKIVRTRFPSKLFDPRVVMALKNGKGR